MPGVADVRYDRRWLDRLASLSAFVRYAGFILAGVLVLAAGLTVANVVRLALYARRDEVEIMELVGAPMAFIRGPFVCEGIIQGGIGAVLALAALQDRAGVGGVAARRPPPAGCSTSRRSRSSPAHRWRSSSRAAWRWAASAGSSPPAGCGSGCRPRCPERFGRR